MSQSNSQYDENNNLISNIVQFFTSDDWINQRQFTYVYDEYNNRISSLDQTWFANNWLNNSQSSFTYDSNNNLITILTQDWEDDNWVNDQKQNFVYNTNNQLSSESYQSWLPNEWRTDFQKSYQYDENINQIFSLHEQFGTSGDTTALRTFFYYAQKNLVSNPEVLESTFQISPNPSSGMVHIDLANHHKKPGNVLVFNSMGKLVYNEAIEKNDRQISLNLENLAEGNYFIQVQQGTQQFSQPLIIVR